MLPRWSAVMIRPAALQHVEVALDVQREHAIELLVGVIEDLLPHVDARRADHGVEPAVPLTHVGERALDRCAVANIERRALPSARVFLDVEPLDLRTEIAPHRG